MRWAELKNDAENFSSRLISILKEVGVYKKCLGLNMDHICVRLKNNDDVNQIKEELTEAGEIISSAEVNGREIYIIQLNEPLKIGDWQVYGVELPHPKPNHSYEDGWEHVEFVLNEAENNMESLRDTFDNTFPNLNQEKVTKRKDSEPHATDDQLPNPTIALTVNDIGIKFHPKTIQEVVGYTK